MKDVTIVHASSFEEAKEIIKEKDHFNVVIDLSSKNNKNKEQIRRGSKEI